MCHSTYATLWKYVTIGQGCSEYGSNFHKEINPTREVNKTNVDTQNMLYSMQQQKSILTLGKEANI